MNERTGVLARVNGDKYRITLFQEEIITASATILILALQDSLDDTNIHNQLCFKDPEEETIINSCLVPEPGLLVKYLHTSIIYPNLMFYFACGF